MVKKIIIGISFFSLFCLGVFLLIVSWLLTDPPDLQSLITPERLQSLIVEQTGLNAEFESLKLNLQGFRKLRLSAKGVKLYKDRNLPPLAQSKQLSLVWDLAQLLSGNIAIDTIFVEGPRADLNISTDGSIQLGTWTVPWLNQDSGTLDFFSLRMNELAAIEGRLRLIPPPEWHLPAFQFSSIFARWQLKQGSIQINTGFEWDGKQGKFAGNFSQDQGIWQGNYKLSNFPLHVFIIPEAPKVFSSMPVDGKFSADGFLTRETSGKIKSRFSWNVQEGRILNPKFPAGEMPVKILNGQADFVADFENQASLTIDVQNAVVPPGTIKGTLSFLFRPGKSPVMTVNASAADWSADQTQPYTYGFMPDVASDWVKAHIYDGFINQVNLDLRWKITSEYHDINDILFLNLRGELSGVNIDPFEGIPHIQNIHGFLHLGLWGVGGEADQGSFPGAELEGGSFAVGYGAPVVTPLKVEILGRIDAAGAWPLVHSFWGDSLPWLENLSLSGSAGARFSLEDPNILDDQVLNLEFQAIPEKVDFEWKFSDQSYAVEVNHGLFLASLDELRWDSIRFANAPLSGILQGRYPFDEEEAVEFRINLEHLTTLLPVNENSGSTMHPWKPRQVSAEAFIRQENREQNETLWKIDLKTTDERKQHLDVKIEWENEDWRIEQFSGKIGQIEASGSLDWSLQEGFLHARAESKTDPFELNGTWQEEQVNISFKAKHFRWQDWLNWKLSSDLLALLPSSEDQDANENMRNQDDFYPGKNDDFPVKNWIVEFEATEFEFSPEVSFPISFSGALHWEDQFQLSLKRLKVGSEKGELYYLGSLKEGDLLLYWEKMELSQWLRWWHDFRIGDSPNRKPASLSAQDKRPNSAWLHNLQVLLEIDQLLIPGSPPSRLQSEFHLQHDLEKLSVNVKEFVLGNQKAAANAVFHDNQLDLQVLGERIDPFYWYNIHRLVIGDETSEEEDSSSILHRINLEIDVESLYFSKDFTPRINLNSVIQLPDKKRSLPFKISASIEEFVEGEQNFTALASFQNREFRLEIEGQRIDMEPWLSIFGDNNAPLGEASLTGEVERFHFKLRTKKLLLTENFSPEIAFEATANIPDEMSAGSLELKVNVEDFIWEKQQAEGSILYENKRLTLDIRGRRIDPEFWYNLSQETESPSAFAGDQLLGTLRSVQLNLTTDHLYFTEVFSPKMSFQSTFILPDKEEAESLQLLMHIKDFRLGKQIVRGEIQLQNQELNVQIESEGIDPKFWIEMARNPEMKSNFDSSSSFDLFKRINLDLDVARSPLPGKMLPPITVRSQLHFPEAGGDGYFKLLLKHVQIPVSLETPAVPNVFPSMPLNARFNASGEASFTSAGQLDGHLSWQVTEGSLGNPVFPSGFMPVAMSGKLDLILAPEQESHLDIDVTEILTPFGTLQGTARLISLFEQRPILTARAHADSWTVNAVKPYLYGLMPKLVRDWFRTRTSEGWIENSDLDLRMELASDYSGVEDILTLDLDIALSDLNVTLMEGFVVENVGGHLELGVWGGEFKIQQGTFPGFELDEGKITLMYGKPAATPLHVDISGKVDGAGLWPHALLFLEEANPLLKQLTLLGEADVSLLLEDSNLTDEEPFLLRVEAFPRNMEAEWKTMERSYRVKDLEGRIEASRNGIKWEGLNFNFERLEGSAQGHYFFDSKTPPRFSFHLKHLENFLPVYADPAHPFAQWFPQKLSAEVLLVPVVQSPAEEGFSLKLDVTASDESEQHLQLKTAWQESKWEIVEIEGKLGQIEAKGYVDKEQEDAALHFKIGPSSEENIDLNLKWRQQFGFISLKSPSFQWQDWLAWELPVPLVETFSNSQTNAFPFQHIEMQLATPAMVFSPEIRLPFSFSGSLDLKDAYHLNIPQLKIDGQEGSFSYSGALERGKVQINWEQLDLSLVNNLVKYLETDPFQLKLPGKSDLKTKHLFEDLEVNIDVASLHLPGNEFYPVHASFHLLRDPPAFTVYLDELVMGEQEADGILTFNDEQHLDLKISGTRVDVIPWVNLMRSWESVKPADGATKASSIQSFHLAFKSGDFYFHENLQVPVVLEFDMKMPSTFSNDLELNLHRFEISGLSGNGTIFRKAGDTHLDLNFEKFALLQSLKDFIKISWQDWTDSLIPAGPSPSEGRLHFNVKAPTYPLHLTGTIPQGIGNSRKIDLHFETIILPRLLDDLLAVPWQNGSSAETASVQNEVLDFRLTVPGINLNVKGNIQWEKDNLLDLDLNFDQIEIPQLVEELVKVSWADSMAGEDGVSRKGGVNFKIRIPKYKLDFKGKSNWEPAAIPSLEMQVDNFAPGLFIEDLLKIPWEKWDNDPARKKITVQSSGLNFDIRAPNHQLHFQGSGRQNGQDYHLVIDNLEWNKQKGTLQLNYNRELLEVIGKFDYLDLKQWNDLVEQSSDILQNPEPSSEKSTPPSKIDDPFTFHLPKFNGSLDLQAKKFKFLSSDFEDFVLQGRLERKKIQIPKLIWKKNGSPAFTMSGYLNRSFQKNRDEQWEGKMSADITDLGDMIKLVFGSDSQINKQYPISGGQTHIQAEIRLLPIDLEADLWKPHADISFHSSEGIVEKGESLVFLLATLSLQSYLKVLEEKLSGFEGKGLVYNTMQSKIAMKGGVFDLEDFIFASPNMRFVASGRIDYEKDVQDLLVCLQPFETLDLFLRNIPLLNLILTNKRGSFLEGCYNSTGPVDDPTIIPLPQTILPGRIRDLLIFSLSDLEKMQ
ncbi:MAG: hypothetical protein HQM13_04310 [SAR324 cluster bacterium]|nr:hypothetical protein [SAR324 cluster bacterium]